MHLLERVCVCLDAQKFRANSIHTALVFKAPHSKQHTIAATTHTLMHMVACSFCVAVDLGSVRSANTIYAAHFGIALRAHREISMSIYNWNRKMKEVICFTVLFFSFEESSSLVCSFGTLFFPLSLSPSLSLFSIRAFLCMWFMGAEWTNVFLICWMKIPLTFSVPTVRRRQIEKCYPKVLWCDNDDDDDNVAGISFRFKRIKCSCCSNYIVPIN